MTSFENIRAVILRETKADAGRLRTEQKIVLATCIGWMTGRPKFEKPNQIEGEVEGVLKDLRRLRRRIEALDHDVLIYARRSQTAEAEDRIFRRMIAASDEDNEQDYEAAMNELDEVRTLPQSKWVDLATKKHLDALEKSLIKVAERVISVAPSGPGKPKNRKAHQVAYAAARAYLELTGEHPTYWHGGETPFSRMLSEIYAIEGVKAGLRGPIEAAMQKLREKY